MTKSKKTQNTVVLTAKQQQHQPQPQTNNNIVQKANASVLQPSKRKLIQKIRRKNHQQTQRLATTFKNVENVKGSTLGSMLSDQPQDQNDYEMLNYVSTGQNRKMKKKLKKLQKLHGKDSDRTFKGMQAFKQKTYQKQVKLLFNPESEMKMRRKKRLDRMDANSRRSKNQVLHKNNPNAKSAK